MTEAEWLSCTHPGQMMLHLSDARGDVISRRKLRLFATGWYRRVVAQSSQNQHSRTAIDLSERYADGCLSEREAEIQRPHHAAFFGAPGSWAMIAVPIPSSEEPMPCFLMEGWHDQIHRERNAELFRDIFRNPFRPVTLDPAWRTSTVLALAQGIYDERAFDRMPILADALQDAGCDSADILTHCRDPQQVHVRGCWVVDLVLGKE